MLRLQCLDFQPDQFVKTHIQNGICLILRKMQFCRSFFRCFGTETDSFCYAFHQTFFYLLAVFAATQDLNDQVDHIAGFDQSFLDLLFCFFFTKKIFIFSGCVAAAAAAVRSQWEDGRAVLEFRCESPEVYDEMRALLFDRERLWDVYRALGSRAASSGYQCVDDQQIIRLIPQR